MATLTTGSSGHLSVEEPPSTTGPQLDEIVTRLKEGARRFARLSLDERIQLATAMRAGYLRVARPSVEAACTAKGIPLGSPMEGRSGRSVPGSSFGTCG